MRLWEKIDKTEIIVNSTSDANLKVQESVQTVQKPLDGAGKRHSTIARNKSVGNESVERFKSNGSTFFARSRSDTSSSEDSVNVGGGKKKCRKKPNNTMGVIDKHNQNRECMNDTLNVIATTIKENGGGKTEFQQQLLDFKKSEMEEKRKIRESEFAETMKLKKQQLLKDSLESANQRRSDLFGKIKILMEFDMPDDIQALKLEISLLNEEIKDIMAFKRKHLKLEMADVEKN